MTSSQVTIGVPVYNGATTLRRAVESAVNQTHPDCVVQICDNGSTDATVEISQALAAAHANVSYFRQPTNIGAPPNFRYLLDQADSPYFMWLAADDYLRPTYVERMVAELERDPGLVTCVPQVLFVRPDGTSRLSDGTYPLQGDVVENLTNYLAFPTDNSRIYGLHRTDVLRRAFTAVDFFVAFDWAIMAASLLYGRHAEVREILLVRDMTPDHAYTVQIRNHARSWLERWLPLLPMTRDLVFRQKAPLRRPVLKALLFINLKKHLDYAHTYAPRYASRIQPFLDRYLMWRLQPQRTTAEASTRRTGTELTESGNR